VPEFDRLPGSTTADWSSTIATTGQRPSIAFVPKLSIPQTLPLRLTQFPAVPNTYVVCGDDRAGAEDLGQGRARLNECARG
jgi:hypothetical protein